MPIYTLPIARDGDAGARLPRALKEAIDRCLRDGMTVASVRKFVREAGRYLVFPGVDPGGILADVERYLDQLARRKRPFVLR